MIAAAATQICVALPQMKEPTVPDPKAANIRGRYLCAVIINNVADLPPGSSAQQTPNPPLNPQAENGGNGGNPPNRPNEGDDHTQATNQISNKLKLQI